MKSYGQDQQTITTRIQAQKRRKEGEQNIKQTFGFLRGLLY